jgi:hypothetical protein
MANRVPQIDAAFGFHKESECYKGFAVWGAAPLKAMNYHQ